MVALFYTLLTGGGGGLNLVIGGGGGFLPGILTVGVIVYFCPSCYEFFVLVAYLFYSF